MLDSPTVPRAARPAFLTPEAELRRLDAHFRRVLPRLHRAPPPGLGPAQRRARARHIEELERYRRGGRFPKNRLFPGMLLPHFIDREGTRCAMGHLIEQAGGADLVHHVARTRNYARVHDLADIPELLLWLEANGLTVNEAALIQPSYCSAPSMCVCNGYSPPAIIEGNLALSAGDNLLVTALYGADVGIAVGDTVPVYINLAAKADGAHVLGMADNDSASVQWRFSSPDAVEITSCDFGLAVPGPLPRQVLIDAKFAEGEAACVAALEAHDPAWSKEQGDCGGPSTSSSGGGGPGTTTGAGGSGGSGGGGESSPGDDGGCSLGVGSTSGANGAVALFLGACLLHRARRASRR